MDSASLYVKIGIGWKNKKISRSLASFSYLWQNQLTITYLARETRILSDIVTTSPSHSYNTSWNNSPYYNYEKISWVVLQNTSYCYSLFYSHCDDSCCLVWYIIVANDVTVDWIFKSASDKQDFEISSVANVIKLYTAVSYPFSE